MEFTYFSHTPIFSSPVRQGTPNFERFNKEPQAFVPVYRIEDDQLIAPPPEAHWFEVVVPPPPGALLGGMPSEWIPPEDWKEPLPMGWVPEGSSPGDWMNNDMYPPPPDGGMYPEPKPDEGWTPEPPPDEEPPQ